MSRTISAGLKAHLEQEVTTIAICWKIVRNDGVELGFTDHDEVITYPDISGGLDYEPLSVAEISALESTGKVSPDNLDINLAFVSTKITRDDLEKGVYKDAELYVFLLNYEDLTQGILMLVSGTLGETELRDYGGKAEFRSLTAPLLQNIGRTYSYQCDAQFCDTRCGLVAASYTVTGTITGVTDRSTFADSGRGEATGYFNYGRITFTSGNNEDRSMEVKTFTAGGAFVMFLPMEYDVEVGDTYSLIAGCDKYAETCKNTFANLLNFRGFPHLPGRDKVFSIPDLK